MSYMSYNDEIRKRAEKALTKLKPNLDTTDDAKLIMNVINGLYNGDLKKDDFHYAKEVLRPIIKKFDDPEPILRVLMADYSDVMESKDSALENLAWGMESYYK